MENKKIFRASIINPRNHAVADCFVDGAIYTENGIIKKIGYFSDVIKGCENNIETVELDGVLMPGFADVHLHWVQHQVRGKYSGELLTWLKEHIWPEEASYIDTGKAGQAAEEFYADMLRAGTVMGMSYSSPHAAATEIAMQKMRGDWIIGNVLMAINAPNDLTDYSLHDPILLNEIMMRNDRHHYALTPRFAPNLSTEILSYLGMIAVQTSSFVQTHLAESNAEIAWVKELFPDAESYTQVYDKAGLLTPKTILGHCIEMNDSEWQCLFARGSWVAHCPSSNEALGNNRMPLEKLQEYHIPYALATDVGAGPSHSMLHVIQRFIAIHRKAGIKISFQEALYRATLAGAEAMNRDAIAGNLCPGKRADFILLPSKQKNQSWDGWFSECIGGTMSELEERPQGTWLASERAA